MVQIYAAGTEREDVVSQVQFEASNKQYRPLYTYTGHKLTSKSQTILMARVVKHRLCGALHAAKQVPCTVYAHAGPMVHESHVHVAARTCKYMSDQ